MWNKIIKRMAKVNITLAELVVKEATKLKKEATKKELDSLSVDLNKLDPDNTEQCIYGQMTSDCFSKRANKLIVKCAERVYNIPENVRNNCIAESVLNGKPKSVDVRDTYFSPIEVYIFLSRSNKGKQALLDYLKGIRKTLKPTDLYKPKKDLVVS